VLHVTHNAADAGRLADEVLHLSGGTVAAEAAVQ